MFLRQENKKKPLSIWKELAVVRFRPIYMSEVARMSQQAGGRKTKGLKVGRAGSESEEMLMMPAPSFPE